MKFSRTKWPRLWRAMQRNRLLKAEENLLHAMRDEAGYPGGISDHDSRLLRLANEVKDLRRSYYEGGR